MYFCISDPPPGLSLGLASLLVSGAPPAPAVVPPGGAVLGARNTEIHSMTKLFSKHTTIVLNEALTADLGDLFT